jgi:hypothetical protein
MHHELLNQIFINLISNYTFSKKVYPKLLPDSLDKLLKSKFLKVYKEMCKKLVILFFKGILYEIYM